MRLINLAMEEMVMNITILFNLITILFRVTLELRVSWSLVQIGKTKYSDNSAIYRLGRKVVIK